MKFNDEALDLLQRLNAVRVAEPIMPERVEHDRRVIPPSRGYHMRGWHPVRKGHGSIPFESKLERLVISDLATYSELNRLKSQPVTVTYRHADRTVRYTPDFLVEFESVPADLQPFGFGLTTYVEVKPRERALENLEKLCRQFSVLSMATGHPVVLLTDRDVASANWGAYAR
jgi:hypothetical protein